MTDKSIDSLADIWPLQAELNARAGFDTHALGQQLRKAEQSGLADEDPLRTDVGRCLKNYVDALSAECHELLECLSWKHWYAEARQGRQYAIQDIQNARVEATDMLFFLISICQTLGMEPEDLFRLYAKKLNINHKRQDENRSQAEHGDHEDENRAVV